LPKSFITKKFLYLNKGHGKNDESQQSKKFSKTLCSCKSMFLKKIVEMDFGP
jgi:hypothetical protein